MSSQAGTRALSRLVYACAVRSHTFLLVHSGCAVLSLSATAATSADDTLRQAAELQAFSCAGSPLIRLWYVDACAGKQRCQTLEFFPCALFN